MNIYDIDNKEMLFFLSEVKLIGAVSIRKIYDNIKPLNQILTMSEDDIYEKTLLDKKKIGSIITSRNYIEKSHEKYLKLESNKINFITVEDEHFPQKLLEIKNSPLYLYTKGKLPSLNKSVAIVGSRLASSYGLSMAENIGFELARKGVEVISGLAYGIDCAAHKGAIRAEIGVTYAVLGNGVNICYPKENYFIYEEILKGHGGIISEFCTGMPPIKSNFPLRNRIIAGLSDIVIIIEAKEKSGSLITAEYALEQGKDVYAVPGRITDVFSKGCNKLISEGAYILTEIDDILERLSMKKEGKLVINEKNIKSLAKNQKKVYSCLDLESKFIEQIVEETELSFGEVYTALMELELSGYIVQVSNNYYMRAM